MKIKKIIFTCFFVFMFIIFAFGSFFDVYASSKTEELFNGGSYQNVNTPVSGGGLIDGINVIIGVFQVVGTGVSLIMITTLGIKYILASVEEKAEIKKTAIPILIGAVLLFGAANIISVLENFSKTTINT